MGWCRRCGHKNSNNALHDTSDHSFGRAYYTLPNDICGMTDCDLDLEFKVKKRLFGGLNSKRKSVDLASRFNSTTFMKVFFSMICRE